MEPPRDADAVARARLSPWQAVLAVALAESVTRVCVCAMRRGLFGVDGSAGSDLLTTVLQQGILLGAALLVLRAAAVPVRAGLALRTPRWADLVWGALAVWACFRVAGSLGVLVGSRFNPPRDDVAYYTGKLAPSSLWGRAARCLAVGVVAPLGEEVFYRGLVFGCLRPCGLWLAATGSALLFAVGHGRPEAIAAAFLGGLGLALVRERSGSLWPGAVGHAGVNGYIALQALARTLDDGTARLLAAALWPLHQVIRWWLVAAMVSLACLRQVGRESR